MSDMDFTQPQGWRPAEGDTIVGKVIRIDAAWSDYIGGNYPLVVIQPENGSAPVAVHCFHDVLRKRMLMLKPKVGERIGIQYVGKQPTRDGRRTVAVYNARIDGRDSDDVWGSMSDPSPRTPATQQDFTPSRQSDVTDDDIPF